MNSQTEKIAGVIGLVLTCLAIFGYAWAATYFEMRTFNRCTGSSATMADALFSNLRVTECKK